MKSEKEEQEAQSLPEVEFEDYFEEDWWQTKEHEKRSKRSESDTESGVASSSFSRTISGVRENQRKQKKERPLFEPSSAESSVLSALPPRRGLETYRNPRSTRAAPQRSRGDGVHQGARVYIGFSEAFTKHT